MSVSNILTLNWTYGSQQITNNVTVAAGSLTAISETISGSSEPEIACTIDVSALKSLYISSDEDVTVSTNANIAGAADDTLLITADKPLVWYDGCGLPNPFASGVDVTSIFVARLIAGAAAFEMRIQQDPTP